jgi:hypothetical protein
VEPKRFHKISPEGAEDDELPKTCKKATFSKIHCPSHEVTDTVFANGHIIEVKRTYYRGLNWTKNMQVWALHLI